MSNGNGSVNPGVAQPPQAAAEAQLAAMLQQGGQVDQILQRSRSTLVTHAESGLHQKITADLQTIRRQYDHPSSYNPGHSPAGATPSYSAALQSALANRTLIDPFLGYCLAEQTGLRKLADSLSQEAWDRYHSQPAAYRKVLNGFIPQSFLDWATGELAKEAFTKGTNATAAQDWQVFEHLLAGQTSDRLTLGFPTGLQKLDAALGGLSGLMIVGGDKGVGKTTLILQMILAALRSDPELVSLLYSLDLSKTLIYDRLLCHEAQMDYRTLVSPNKGEDVLRRLQQGHDSLLRDILPRLRVIERTFPPPHDGFWFNALCGTGNALLTTSGKNKLLVAIDLFQRMDVPTSLNGKPENENSIRLSTDAERDDFRLDAIKNFRDSFRQNLQPNGPPVIIASEVRKGDDSRRELTRDDLKGSGRMSSDADTVIIMHGPREFMDGATTVPVTLRIDKGRDGVIRRDIPLLFHHTVYRFEETQPAPQESNRRTLSSAARDTFDAAS
jgi:hypothetical protein